MKQTFQMECMEHLLKWEKKINWPTHDDIIKHPLITQFMREILIDWLVDIHKHFHLHEESLYWTVHIIDLFMVSPQAQTISQEKYQLIGCTAIWLASKMEDEYMIDAKHLVNMSRNSFTILDVLQMEEQMIQYLDYQLPFVSVYQMIYELFIIQSAPKMVHCATIYISQLALCKANMCSYIPSVQAVACIMLGYWLVYHRSNEFQEIKTFQALLDKFPLLNKYVDPCVLLPCLKCLYAILTINKQTLNCLPYPPRPMKRFAVRRKFSKDNWCNVSKIPHVQLLE